MQRYRAEPFMQPIALRSPGEAGAHPAMGEAPRPGFMARVPLDGHFQRLRRTRFGQAQQSAQEARRRASPSSAGNRASAMRGS